MLVWGRDEEPVHTQHPFIAYVFASVHARRSPHACPRFVYRYTRYAGQEVPSPRGFNT